MKVTPSAIPARLSDAEILSIFRTIADWPSGTEESFIKAYARMILKATRLDFRTMRPTTLLLIVKYNLLGYLPAPAASTPGKKKSA